MKYSEQEKIDLAFDKLKELKKTADLIVKQSKSEAHVDTGRLKRSISYVINENGDFEFTEAFYGQFYENSKLQENIKKYFPSEEPYLLIYTDDNGQPYQTVRKYKSGRISENINPNKKAKKNILDTLKRYTESNKIGGIKNFLKKIANGKADISAD